MPLAIARKLAIKKGDTLLTLHAPATFRQELAPLPEGVKIITAGKKYNQVHWFATNRAQVEKETEKILALLQPGIVCWIYFPKGSSGMQADLSRDKGWDTLLAHSHSLDWLSLFSFNETWSAFACRLKTAGKTKPAKQAERPILAYIDTANKTVRLPEDFALVLKKNKPAADFFAGLSFTNRKEYVEWIVSAKQDTTRKNRVQGSLERLIKGWKNPRNL